MPRGACWNEAMNPNQVSTRRELLEQIRTRLQEAHFAARDMSWLEHSAEREPIADQLHMIRLLAEELDARLAA
jgi:hypothetical protein